MRDKVPMVIILLFAIGCMLGFALGWFSPSDRRTYTIVEKAAHSGGMGSDWPFAFLVLEGDDSLVIPTKDFRLFMLAEVGSQISFEQNDGYRVVGGWRVIVDAIDIEIEDDK